MEPFLALLPGWSARRDQPLRKWSGIGEMRRYLHSTQVSMKGREQRRFPEKNVASIHTDQRFRYKIRLRREEAGNELRCGSLRPLMEREALGDESPPSWPQKLWSPAQGPAWASPSPERSRMRNNMQAGCFMQPSTVALSSQPDLWQWSHRLRQCVRHAGFGLLYMN